jgi:hypothetical protein
MVRLLSASAILLLLIGPAHGETIRALSGATAQVSSSAANAFRCIVNALETQGYPIKFMGGYARGGHIRGSLHYSGNALDINQTDRGVTTPRMPSNEVSLAAGCGLVSGASWKNNDSGHFQIGNLTYAARRHHTNRHYALR